MRSIILLAAAFAVSGCYADRALGSRMTDSRGKGPTDVVVGSEALAAWVRLSPQERKAATEAMSRAAGTSAIAPQRLAIAITDGELPNGAAAAVVRETGLPQARILVLSSRNLTQDAFSLASTALLEDEARAPIAKQRRILTVQQDGEVTERVSKGIHRLESRQTEPQSESAMTIQHLLSAATSSGVIDLEGLGKVRLLRFD